MVTQGSVAISSSSGGERGSRSGDGKLASSTSGHGGRHPRGARESGSGGLARGEASTDGLTRVGTGSGGGMRGDPRVGCKRALVGL
jgi:hypothetical protein